MPITSFQLPSPTADPAQVSARLSVPDAAPRAAVLLAHGAGYSMDSPWMRAVELGLVARGHAVLAFHYPYRERAVAEGKRMLPPDRPEVLLEMHRRALVALAERCPDRPRFLVGKSLGARFSTLLAAQAPGPERPEVAGLALLGYPLHSEKRPEVLRAEHFPRVTEPCLFLQGTRDRLCDLERLASVLPDLGGPHRLVVLEGADHGFAVPKALGLSEGDVLERLLGEVHTHFDAHSPSP